MYTFPQALEDRFKQGEAEWFARQLQGTEPNRMPGIADLMADNRAGRRPRLRCHERAEPAE